MKKLLLALTFLIIGCTPDTLPISEESIETTYETQARKTPILSSEYVVKKIGEPKIKRKENDAQVWIYPENQCILFIYVGDDDLVKHMEIGNPTMDTDEKDPLPCLKKAGKLR
ncbi:MAG: hypothetical protein MJ250_08240 [Alphaproteobacteria bacterium]|nr:hypothetical protein [Alphaproteobacteria bacterium]